MAPLKCGSDYIEKSTELPYGKEKKKLNFDERYQEGKEKKRKT